MDLAKAPYLAHNPEPGVPLLLCPMTEENHPADLLSHRTHITEALESAGKSDMFFILCAINIKL